MLLSKPAAASYCLVYRSFAAPPWIADGDLSEICAESQAQNAQSGVTGVLMFRDGVFLQVMEGGTVDILALSARIAADRRNDRLRILWHGNVAERRFPRWTMGCFLGVEGDRALDPMLDWTPARIRDLATFYDRHVEAGLKPGFTKARRLT